MNLRTCTSCGWVAFGITREKAEQDVRGFNSYYQTLPPETQQLLYGGKGATIQSYEKCWCGATYENSRAWREGDFNPDGHTLNPIIME